MGLASDFGLLFILEARDKASETFDRIEANLDRFTETADRAGEAARASGAAIDEALGRDVSASDRLDVANARLEASQAKAAESARALSDAERELLAAQREAAAGADADAAANDRLIAANAKLTGAQRDAAAAARGVRDAQASQVDATRAAAAAGDAAAASQVRAMDAEKEHAAALSGVTKAAGLVTLGMAAAGYETVKMAGNFQDATVHLVTDAGESAKNLAMVQAGILNVSTATGQSATDITNAMYHIESAGYHGAAGLKLLKVAAEGARVGGADLDTVSKTLVGTMRAYGPSIGSANQVMNMLIATVGQGDMRMQDLASALSNVAPTAAKAGIRFSQLGAALATMTAQGMSTDQASQDLNATIGSLMNPTHAQMLEMNQLGISSNRLSQELGKQGLTATLHTLTASIAAHVKGGQVWMSAYQNATVATQDLKIMLKSMPPAFAGMARGYLDGTMSAKQWRTALQAQTPINQHLLTQFATLADKAHSFNSVLTSGSPAAQTISAALQKLTGTSAGLRTSLMLTGSNAKDFAGSAALIQSKAGGASGGIAGWSAIQGTFNFKLAQAKTGLENTGIAIGTALLPAVSSLLQGITRVVIPIAEWTAKHRKLTEVLFAGVAGIAATIAIIGTARKAFHAVSDTIGAIRKTVGAVSGVLRKLAGTAAETAAEQEASAGEAAAAQETAAAETSSSWIASAARTVAAWAVAGVRMIAQAAVWVAQNTAKVAVAVAENLAGAAATAAGWIAANAAMTLGIGLVVAAVIAAVVLIVTHWRQVSHAVAKVWGDVYAFIRRVVSDVVGWVKGHWPLLLAIITGPLGLAVYAVVKYWHDIEHWFDNGIHAVDSVLQWFNRLPGLFRGWLGAAASAVWSEGAKVLDWYFSLPGKAWRALSVMYGDMLAVGKNIVIGIWNGMAAMGSWLWSQVTNFGNSVLNSIKSAFGISSPSRETHNHGRMLAAGLAQGITAGTPLAVAAAQQMAARVLAATSGLAGPGHTAGARLAVPAGARAAGAGGGTVINLYVTGNHVTSDKDINLLIDKIGKKLATVVLPSAGRATRAF